jgi:FKBP-type peptidyl-prolyl cis-trans isomerase SlyD
LTSIRGFWRSAAAAPAAALCHHSCMQISAPCVVSLSWKLNDAQNRPIDELSEPVEFFYGGDDLLAKVEEALAGFEAGADLQLQLEPEHAFGEYKAALVCFEDRKLFPEQLEVGMAFEGLPQGAATPDMPADAIYLVTEVYPDHVVLDGNHPLAGMALRLDIQVRGVREATDEEVEARTVGGTALTVLGGGTATPTNSMLH